MLICDIDLGWPVVPKRSQSYQVTFWDHKKYESIRLDEENTTVEKLTKNYRPGNGTFDLTWKVNSRHK